MKYIDAWNKSEEKLAKIMQHVVVRPTQTIVTVGGSTNIVKILNTDHDIEKSGVFIDADFRDSQFLPIHETLNEEHFSYLRLISSLEGSILEHKIINEIFKVQGISTAKLFNIAMQNNINFHYVSSDNIDQILPELPFSQNII